jgi:hypothetical protein
VDPDLQQALTQFEGRLTARIDSIDTRSTTTIDAIETRLQTRIEAMEPRLHTRLEEMETRLRTYVDERVEITETKLLTAFHNWASPSDARQRTHAAALRAIDLEMESLSERVGKLEGQKPQ